MEFEWDPEKNEKNIEEHGVDFEDVKPLFESVLPSLDKEDDREDYGEERRIRLGWVEGLPVTVAYTMRGQIVRLISARVAEPAEEVVLVTETEGEKQLQHDRWEQEKSMERRIEAEKARIESKKEREEK